MTKQQPGQLSDWLHARRQQLDTAFTCYLPAKDVEPAVLAEAAQYAVRNGGKRLRALLLYAAGELCEAPAATLDAAAVAVEMVHSYSLVHDDLPCMDDDVLRRGQPTLHVRYGEAMALLVGDALQALAFDVLAHAPDVDATQCLQLCRTLAHALGLHGMVAGQALDLLLTGSMAQARVAERVDEAVLQRMHARKTGALIRAGIIMGALCGSPDAPRLSVLSRFGELLGLAYQVVDDVLDVTQDATTLGKSAGKDARQLKPTYVSVLGLEASQQLARRLHREALEVLAPLPQAVRLRQLADMLVERVS